MGMLGGIGQANRQYHRSKKLMDHQLGHQMQLNRQGHDLQFDMWNKTNYGAQVKHMLEAGLNPALMYGSAGQGGTTGSQGGGSAAGGSAVGERVMDLQNALIGKQMEEADSRIELNKAKEQDITGETPEAKARIQKLISEKLGIDQNTVKAIQETTNLKTLDEWNKVKQGLDELKESKKVTGSSIVDLMTQLGLDPVNNTEDANAVRVLLGLFYGSNVAKNIMQGIGGLKGNVNVKKFTGDIIDGASTIKRKY